MNSDLVSTKAEQYAHLVYGLTKKLPKEEMFGISSQLRRASLSVPLNIVEGYARQTSGSQIQFLHIAYGSLKESQFLINFCIVEKLLTVSEANIARELGEELARMLWLKTKTLKAKTKP